VAKAKRPAAKKTAPQRIQNTVLRGVGGTTLQDRSAQSSASEGSTNPYYSTNPWGRWQEYVRWYRTSWEAEKLINIPVDDALRKPFKISGVDDGISKPLMDTYLALNVEQALRRAMIQERLLGGAALFGVFKLPPRGLSGPLHVRDIERGDLQAVNVIDISRITRSVIDSDPFSPTYDKISSIAISGIDTHCSRVCLFDGDALFNPATSKIFEGMRVSLFGFGESKLATLYDLLVRATGTQQGAYHLVNMASCLILSVENLRSISSTGGSAVVAELEKIVTQLSSMRAAMVEAKGVEFKQHSASFGSVPELVMTFLQILSAASDIPATRFLGQAPGGLNATGTSDLENYYNNVGALQRRKLMPAQRKLVDWIGASLWGGMQWLEMSNELEIEYEPLWSIDAVQQAQIDNTYAMAIRSFFEIGLIDMATATAELKARKIFLTNVDSKDFLSQGFKPSEPLDGVLAEAA